MGLIKLPLRIATVRALSGATWAGDAVFDSAIVPLETKVADEKGVPLIVVYTDDARGDGPSANQRNPSGFLPDVSLTLHLAVATEISADDGSVILTRSDAAFEAALDILEAQVVNTLQKADGLWPELWRIMIRRVGERFVRRGASARKGVRFAARELSLPIESYQDPSGRGVEYPWGDVIETFGTDPDLAPLAETLRGFCEFEMVRPAWRSDLATTGLDRHTARALGFVTADGEEVAFT